MDWNNHPIGGLSSKPINNRGVLVDDEFGDEKLPSIYWGLQSSKKGESLQTRIQWNCTGMLNTAYVNKHSYGRYSDMGKSMMKTRILVIICPGYVYPVSPSRFDIKAFQSHYI